MDFSVCGQKWAANLKQKWSSKYIKYYGMWQAVLRVFACGILAMHLAVLLRHWVINHRSSGFLPLLATEESKLFRCVHYCVFSPWCEFCIFGNQDVPHPLMLKSL